MTNPLQSSVPPYMIPPSAEEVAVIAARLEQAQAARGGTGLVIPNASPREVMQGAVHRGNVCEFDDKTRI